MKFTHCSTTLRHAAAFLVLGLGATTLTFAADTAPAKPLATTTEAIQDRIFAPAPGFDREAASVVSLLEQFHYNRNAVKPNDYGDVIPNFMTNFDGQRMIFLETDKAAFTNRYNTRWIYNNLTSLGKVDPAYDVFAVYSKRVTDRIHWVLAKLDEDIDLTGHDGYLIDRKDAPWPVDEAEADTIWTQRLKNEIINEMLNKKTLDESKKEIRKRYERWLKNLADIEPKDISESYLTTVARLYDPHSDYWSAESLDEFSISIKLQLIGIGAVLSVEDDYCTINEIVVGGPADLSKQLQPKDKIIAVAEEGAEPVDIIGMKLRKVVQLIRGKKDTKVHLTVIPAADTTQRKQIVITRDVISLDAQRARGAIYDVPAPDGNGTIPLGVISLPGFYDAGVNEKGVPSPSATQDIAKLITQFQEAGGVKGLVLDLRSNGGGLLSEAIKLTGLFVKAGPVVQVKNSYGQVQVDNSNATDVLYTGPLAVLVNRFSASASEIVAGALQNYGRAIVIGDTSTHGKGTVQQVLEMKQIMPALARLNNKTGAVKLTIQKFYLPSGDSTQLKGVVTDIALPSVDEFLPVGEKSLPHALAWDEIAASKFQGQPLDAGLIATLKNSSEKRQTSLEEFSYLRKGIEHFKARYDQKIVPLNLDERLAQKAEDKTFKKAQDEERNRLAKSDGYNSREFLLGPPKEKNRKAAKTEKPKATDEKSGDDDNNKDTPKPDTDAQPAPPTPNDQSSKTESNDTDASKPNSTKTNSNNANTLPGIRLAGADGKPTASTTTSEDKPDSADKTDTDDKTDSTGEEDEDAFSPEQLDEDAKKLDIHLRESLRILSDAIDMANRPGPGVAADAPAPLTLAAVKRG